MPSDIADDVVAELMDDLEQLRKTLQILGPTPFFVRTYVRTLFSIVEAWAYHVKQKAFRRGTERGNTFSKREIEVVHEYRQKQGGATGEAGSPKTIRASDNVRVAIRLWARVHGGEPPPLNGELPAMFSSAQAFRNRITHPKLKSDLAVEPENIGQAIGVLSWLRDVMAWQSRLELAHIDRVEQELKASSAELRARILAAGRVEPFKGTVEDLYTAPRLDKK